METAKGKLEMKKIKDKEDDTKEKVEKRRRDSTAA